MADILDVLCTTTYDPELDCLVIVWHGYASSNQFRAICERALDIVKKHNLKKGISDNRGMKIISAPDQQWVLENYLPRLTATGYHVSATIIPTDHFAQLNLQGLTDKIDENALQQRFFKTMNEAKSWIKTV